MALEKQLIQILEPTITAMGYEFVGLEHLGQGRHSILRIYIDSEKGVGLDDCERVSRQVSALLDVEDPIKGEYNLEVSSPGLERPLFTAEQFNRFQGHEVKVRILTPINKQRKFRGFIKKVVDDEITLECGGELIQLHLADVAKAHLCSPQ